MATLSTLKTTAAVLLGVALLAAGMSPAPVATAAPPDAGAAQTCSNAAQFVADATVPDNTIMRAGASFTKTWRLRNTGTCTWSTSYKLVRDSGAALGGPVSVKVPRAVARNSPVDISVQLVAPSTRGTYTGYWQLADAGNRRFGPKIKVVIVVPDPALGEELPDTLTFMGGAGGGTTKTSCAYNARNAGGQSMTVTPIGRFEQGTELCIYGLPAYSTVKVTLVSPSGARYSAQFDVGGPVPDFTGA